MLKELANSLPDKLKSMVYNIFMIKRFLCYLVFILFGSALFSQQIDRRDHRFVVQSIPFDQFWFTMQIEGRRHNSVMTILGWSKDGKMLFRIDKFVDFDDNIHAGDYIIDLVTDEVVWSEEIVYATKNYELNDFYNTNRRKVLEDIIRKYAIEPVAGETGEFPFVDSDGEKYNILKEESPETKNQHERLDVRISIYEMSNSGKRKYINQITELDKPEWVDNNFLRKLQFFYAKSPYEHRLAVVSAIPIRQREYDFTYFGYRVFGSHLDMGL